MCTKGYTCLGLLASANELLNQTTCVLSVSLSSKVSANRTGRKLCMSVLLSFNLILSNYYNHFFLRLEIFLSKSDILIPVIVPHFLEDTLHSINSTRSAAPASLVLWEILRVFYPAKILLVACLPGNYHYILLWLFHGLYSCLH